MTTYTVSLFFYRNIEADSEENAKYLAYEQLIDQIYVGDFEAKKNEEESK